MATVIEQLQGVIDGANTVFTTSLRYVPGTVRVAINGLFRAASDDGGWTETGPQEVTLNEAPVSGDVVQAVYRAGA